MLGRLRVLLVEDASLMRDGLAALLCMEAGVEVIGRDRQHRAGRQAATAARPDVAIVDFAPAGGIETIAALRDRWPSVRVLVLTSSEDDCCSYAPRCAPEPAVTCCRSDIAPSS